MFARGEGDAVGVYCTTCQTIHLPEPPPPRFGGPLVATNCHYTKLMVHVCVCLGGGQTNPPLWRRGGGGRYFGVWKSEKRDRRSHLIQQIFSCFIRKVCFYSLVYSEWTSLSGSVLPITAETRCSFGHAAVCRVRIRSL